MAIDTTWIDDPALWDELRAAILPVVSEVFTEAFIVGAEMGAMQEPAKGTRPISTELLTDLFAQGVRQLDPDVQPVLPYDFEATLAAASEVIRDYTDEWWEQFNASTRRQLRNLIAQAEAQGMTTAQVAQRLAPLFGPQRARTIAVSELTNLMGMGAQETYRRAGFGYWEWRTVRDARVDEICTRLDRRRFPMSVRFRRAHVHCRCWPVPAGRPAVQPSLFAA